MFWAVDEAFNRIELTKVRNDNEYLTSTFCDIRLHENCDYEYSITNIPDEKIFLAGGVSQRANYYCMRSLSSIELKQVLEHVSNIDIQETIRNVDPMYEKITTGLVRLSSFLINKR